MFDVKYDPEDWEEDKDLENGNYSCLCRQCGCEFTGHKRRIICKKCATNSDHVWVTTLGSDKGASLAQEIIDSHYKKLPSTIVVDSLSQLRTFGGVCPKLKAIILQYKIRVIEAPYS